MSKLIHSKYNPDTGVTIEYHANQDGSVTVRQFLDVDEQLSTNVAELNTHSAKSRNSMQEGLGRKVASIPIQMAEQLKSETGINILTCNSQDLKHLLNNPNYSKLRTNHGRL